MNRKTIGAIYYSLTFVGLFTFFFFAHPMILFNADDWYYASYWRRPLPIIGGYNGIKVFPETFMPLVSEIGALVLYPITHNYLKSLAFVYAIALIIFIMAFIILLERLLDNFVSDNRISKCLSFLILMFNFLIYKNDWYQNMHLFYAQDPTCVFHYTIPALLNLCLVLFFLSAEIIDKRSLSAEIIEKKLSPARTGLLFLALYLAIFSNMFNNIILASFSIVTLLLNLKNKKGLVKKAWLHMVICGSWFLAIIIQFLDPRNEDASKQGMVSGITGALSTLMKQVLSVNKMLALIIVMVIAIAIIKFFVGKRNNASTHVYNNILVHIILSMIVLVLYLIALATVAGKGYLARPDVLIGIFEYGFICIAVIATYVFTDNKESNRCVYILPILAFILTSQTLNYCKSYDDYNIFSISWQETYLASQDIVEQFSSAESSDPAKLQLHVINNENWNNIWPYPTYVGNTISDTLTRHGVIKKYIETEIIYDNDKNNELSIHIK